MATGNLELYGGDLTGENLPMIGDSACIRILNKAKQGNGPACCERRDVRGFRQFRGSFFPGRRWWQAKLQQGV